MSSLFWLHTVWIYLRLWNFWLARSATILRTCFTSCLLFCCSYNIYKHWNSLYSFWWHMNLIIFELFLLITYNLWIYLRFFCCWYCSPFALAKSACKPRWLYGLFRFQFTIFYSYISYIKMHLFCLHTICEYIHGFGIAGP